MANQIIATVYQIDGNPLASPIEVSFLTSDIMIKEAVVGTIPSVNAAIFYYPNTNNKLQDQVFFVSETLSDLLTASNAISTTQVQATVLEINEDPQIPGGVQYTFPVYNIAIWEATPVGGVNSFIQYKNKTYSVAETISSLVAASNSGSPIEVTLPPFSSDAFDRLRASSPFTIGDYKHIYGLNINFLDKLANGGTVTFQSDQSSALLATTSDPSSSAIHQTKIYHNYIPGKSQLIFSTFCFKAPVVNVTKRTGYFDENDGIYFEQNGAGVLSFCVRTNTSGTPSDASKVAQSSWNTDKCDGTGPSGYDLDITTTQLFFTDFTWLGVGRVRCGFLVNGQFIIAHQFMTSNTIDVPYMSTPNLPVRCEIFNTGATTGDSFNQICSTVISEGGDADAGQDWSALNTTLRTVAAGATIPLLAIRLTNTFQSYPNRVLVRLQEFSLYSVKEPLVYKVVKLPNLSYLTGATWASVDSRSAVSFSVDATAYTDGLTFASGYVSAAVGNRGAVNSDPSASNARQNYIAQNYDSTDSEIYAIVVTNVGTTSTTASASAQWREIY